MRTHLGRLVNSDGAEWGYDTPVDAGDRCQRCNAHLDAHGECSRRPSHTRQAQR